MAEFDSSESYSHFRSKTMSEQRYFRDAETERFLDTVVATSQKRVETLREGAIVYRAQLGHDYYPPRDEDEDWDISGHDAKRMVPLRTQASDGRANPKGLPVLYVATRATTAMAEVRPWIGAKVSCGQFKILRDLKIVRCSTTEGHKSRLPIYLDGREPDAAERELIVWDDIDKAFSRPVTPSDMVADYVPTQVLAEFFKISGFDGVAYESSLGDGHNIALFDIDCAKLLNCSVYDLEKIEFKFDECANRYFVRENADSETPLS